MIHKILRKLKIHNNDIYVEMLEFLHENQLKQIEQLKKDNELILNLYKQRLRKEDVNEK